MSDAQLQVGQVLAERYWLKERLGRGAVADVFRARHVRVPREFAIKVLHAHLMLDEKTRARFEREAELAGRLRHRNIAGVVDVGETARTRYLVMELAEGTSLASLIHGTPMASARVIDLVRQICDGLHHAHEHGLVHRDLKPENVIIETVHGREVPRIVDFGLAILRESVGITDERLTTAGIVVGTPQYLAPEAARGKTFDRRADLFALGVSMYEMLTGVLPFDGDGVDVALANISAPTPPMSTRAPGVAVDPLLEELTRRLLAKSPDERPATAHDVRELLDRIESDRAGAAAELGVALAPAPAPEHTSTDPPGEATTLAPPEPDLSTRELVELAGPSRGRWIAFGALLVALVGLGVSALMRGDAPSRAPAAAAAAAMTSPPAPPSIATTPTTPTPIPIAEVPLEEAPRRPRRVATAPSPRPAITAVPVDDAPATGEVAAVTNEELVRLYTEVGRELKAISDRREDLAADDLWQRYRHLRINDVLASGDRRVEARDVLVGIRRELARRFGRSATRP